jgi:hypothetical protein
MELGTQQSCGPPGAATPRSVDSEVDPASADRDKPDAEDARLSNRPHRAAVSVLLGLAPTVGSHSLSDAAPVAEHKNPGETQHDSDNHERDAHARCIPNDWLRDTAA